MEATIQDFVDVAGMSQPNEGEESRGAVQAGGGGEPSLAGRMHAMRKKMCALLDDAENNVVAHQNSMTVSEMLSLAFMTVFSVVYDYRSDWLRVSFRKRFAASWNRLMSIGAWHRAMINAFRAACNEMVADVASMSRERFEGYVADYERQRDAYYTKAKQKGDL